MLFIVNKYTFLYHSSGVAYTISKSYKNDDIPISLTIDLWLIQTISQNILKVITSSVFVF